MGKASAPGQLRQTVSVRRDFHNVGKHTVHSEQAGGCEQRKGDVCRSWEAKLAATIKLKVHKQKIISHAFFVS